MAEPGYISGMTKTPSGADVDDSQRKGLALLLGIVIPLCSIFLFNDWFTGSETLSDLVSRVIVVAGVIAAVGAMLLVKAYDEPTPSFAGRMGNYLVADGAVLTAVVSLIGVFSSLYF